MFTGLMLEEALVLKYSPQWFVGECPWGNAPKQNNHPPAPKQNDHYPVPEQKDRHCQFIELYWLNVFLSNNNDVMHLMVSVLKLSHCPYCMLYSAFQWDGFRWFWTEIKPTLISVFCQCEAKLIEHVHRKGFCCVDTLD